MAAGLMENIQNLTSGVVGAGRGPPNDKPKPDLT
jgi:hypothetical protein